MAYNGLRGANLAGGIDPTGRSSQHAIERGALCFPMALIEI